MYGYRTKHKILDYYVQEMLKAEVKIPPIKIPLTVFAKSIKGVNENKIATLLLEMKFEGLFTFYDAPPPAHEQLIEITNAGLSAHIGETFLKKNNEIFWKSLMNVTMTLANVAVAITAIWALTKDNDELQRIEERVRILEKSQEAKQAITNPNKMPITPSDQTKSIDSAKLSKDTTSNKE